MFHIYSMGVILRKGAVENYGVPKRKLIIPGTGFTC